MRTTVDLNRELLREAKRRAARQGTSLRDVIEAALRVYFGQDTRHSRKYRLEWHTERGQLQPGVRPDDRDRLFDIMDE